MAKFEAELPNNLIKEFENLYSNLEENLGKMTRAGAEVAYKNVLNNMRKAFKNPSRLEKNLKITKTYKTRSDSGINTKIGFYGYLEGSEGQKLSYRNKKTGKRYVYYNGIPASLVARAREFGSSRGETKKPFFRKSFKKSEIEKAMLAEQEKFLPKE